jgi:hypothetical protein
MRTDRRTDMTKLVVAFRNFTNAPKDSSDAIRRRKMEDEGLIFLQTRIDELFFLQSHNITVFLIFQNAVGLWKL